MKTPVNTVFYHVEAICVSAQFRAFVHDPGYRLSRIRAAELGTSVSALVRRHLGALGRGQATGFENGGAGTETEAERRCRLLTEAFADIDARGGGLRMADKLSREALHDRDALR